MTDKESKGAVGFIGLGMMGRSMALNLLKGGFVVRAFDLREEAVDDVAQHGAVKAASVRDAVEKTDVAITMLPNTPHVEEVVGQILQAPPAGRLVIDMSTIAPEGVRRMYATCKEVGLNLLDAPVSGGPQGARNGTLTIMVGGDKEAYEQAIPYFSAMGTTINHVGATGSGQVIKLCNQLICGLNIQAICEALALGRAAGVDLYKMREALLGGSAASWMLDTLGKTMIERDARAGFRIDLMLKDLGLVADLARETAVPLPGTALVTSQYIDARAHGEDRNGNHALFKVYDRMANQATG
jgi:2-hydroxy-3-oxopropionate reductase